MRKETTMMARGTLLGMAVVGLLGGAWQVAHAEPYLWGLAPEYNNTFDPNVDYKLARFDVATQAMRIYPIEFGEQGVPGEQYGFPCVAPDGDVHWLVSPSSEANPAGFPAQVSLATFRPQDGGAYDLLPTGLTKDVISPAGVYVCQFAIWNAATAYAIIGRDFPDYQLHEINLTTGQAAPGRPLGSLVAPAGRWGVAGQLLYAFGGLSADWGVCRMDPTLASPVTGEALWDELASGFQLPFESGLTGLPDGRLFTITRKTGDPGVYLVQIEFLDETTLSVAQIGGDLEDLVGDAMYATGLTSADDGMLYCSASHATGIIQIDPDTGAATPLGGFPGSVNYRPILLGPMAVPEPATLALLAAGALALIRRRARRRRR
jgi:hypothetical protein